MHIYMSALCARTKPPPGIWGFRAPLCRRRVHETPGKKSWGFRAPSVCRRLCCFNTVSMLFQYCFNTVSILFQYCFNTVSMLFLTISDYLQPAAYRLQAAACRLQPAGCKLQPAACSLQATPWALKGPEYAKTYHFLMILATPTP